MDITIRRARKLRRAMTDAEQVLWYHLRDRRLAGFKFVRQVPIGCYIADYVCRDKNLIVELDGGQHAEKVEYDMSRTDYMNNKGFQVLRFWNNDVMKNRQIVLEKIYMVLNEGQD